MCHEFWPWLLPLVNCSVRTCLHEPSFTLSFSLSRFLSLSFPTSICLSKHSSLCVCEVMDEDSTERRGHLWRLCYSSWQQRLIPDQISDTSLNSSLHQNFRAAGTSVKDSQGAAIWKRQGWPCNDINVCPLLRIFVLFLASWWTDGDSLTGSSHLPRALRPHHHRHSALAWLGSLLTKPRPGPQA